MANAKVKVEAAQRFGWSVVVDPEIRLPLTEGRRRSGSRQGPRGALMRCDCGTEYKVILGNLTAGNSKSCGCRRNKTLAALASKRNQTHGLSRHPHFPRWSSMVARCDNPANPSYERYGGRGIRVHPDWATDPAAFIRFLEEELGPCPPDHSLDRIDNNGNYEPGNLRWADWTTQRKNQRHPSSPRAPRTFCKKGHALTPENTIRQANGERRCRSCRNAWHNAQYRARKQRGRDVLIVQAETLRQLVRAAERAASSDADAAAALAALADAGLFDPLSSQVPAPATLPTLNVETGEVGTA